MSVSNFDELKAHVGHKIEVVTYGDENAAIECVDCNEVLVDFNKEQEYPVGVTISYTMYVTATDPENALRIANNMGVEELVAHVSENPTIEIEEVDDDALG